MVLEILVKSRKIQRKEERRAKKKSKRRRDKHHEVQDDDPMQEAPVRQNTPLVARKRQKAEIPAQSPQREEIVDSVSKSDPYKDMNPDVAAALRNDDAEIAELEAKLGLSNSKEKTKLHREYAKLEGYGEDFGDFLDGLDNLTDRISSETYVEDSGGDNVSHPNDNGHFSDSSDDDEVVPMKTYSVDELGEYDGDINVLDERSESDNSEQNSIEADNNLAPADGCGSDEDDSNAEVESKLVDTYRPTEGEDIYGNKKDGLTSAPAPTKYVPPHLRKLKEQNNNEERIDALRSLDRSLNNVLNRLSEDMLISVVQSISKLYPSYPTSDVNDSLWKNLRNACIASHMLMSGLIPVYVACLAGVHFQTGDQVQLGGHILEAVVTDLWEELSTGRSAMKYGSVADDIDGFTKEASNLMLVLCYLYNYGIVHCTFMYSVIRELIQEFSELDVELLLLILSHSGYSLRSDDPSSLKEIVLLVQDRAKEAKASANNTGVASSSRTEYMISAIADLKNNKKSKQNNVFAVKTTKLRKLLGCIKSYVAAKGAVRASDSSLRIKLSDILNADVQGRWWKVGASWLGNQFQQNGEEDNKDSKRTLEDLSGGAASGSPSDRDTELLTLASKLRMNTDIKRSIFCIVMGSEDCDDSFEKLVRAGMLKNRTERDAVRVLMECCGNEKTYNPFYSHLARRICDYQPQCKFTFQLAFWDVFKQFSNLKIRKAANLAKLLFNLVAVHHSLKLGILKVIDMSPDELPESGVIFLTIFFSSIFDAFDSPTEVKDLFDRGIPTQGSLPMGEQDERQLNDSAEGLRESLSVFFLQTLQSSPKNKKKSKFRANFKAAVKACETEDGLDSMMAM